MAQSVAVTQVKQPSSGVPFILRIIGFFVLGWELTGIWILVAWALNATIFGRPFGLWMIDRVPQVLTLKSRPGAWVLDLNNGRSRYVSVKQRSWLIRGVYFLLIGWWLSLLWAGAAWLLCATILGLPLGVLMLHALPAVTTLQRR
jgi:uncharacterized membrane protein YccF (DUF307 family)